MNIGKLRKAIEGLPDDTEVILEWPGDSQRNAVYAEVCTQQNGGLHYSEETKRESIKHGDGLDPEAWDELKKPTFKIVA